MVHNNINIFCVAYTIYFHLIFKICKNHWKFYIFPCVHYYRNCVNCRKLCIFRLLKICDTIMDGSERFPSKKGKSLSWSVMYLYTHALRNVTEISFWKLLPDLICFLLKLNEKEASFLILTFFVIWKCLTFA